MPDPTDPNEMIRVPVRIKNETDKAWCIVVIGATRYRKGGDWIKKSRTTFEPDEALSLDPNGTSRSTAGYMTLRRGYAAALGHEEAADAD